MGFNFGSKKNEQPASQANATGDAKPAATSRGFTLPNRSATTGTPSQLAVSPAGTAPALPGSPSTGQEAAKAAAESLRAALNANPTPQMPAAPMPQMQTEAKAANEALAAVQFQHPTQPNDVAAASQEQFHINVKRLYENFPNKDLIAPVIKRVLIDLQAHPEFESFLAPEDIGMMVRLLRANYGAVKAVATEKKEKQKKTKQKKADAAGVDLSDLGALLNFKI